MPNVHNTSGHSECLIMTITKVSNIWGQGKRKREGEEHANKMRTEVRKITSNIQEKGET